MPLERCLYTSKEGITGGVFCWWRIPNVWLNLTGIVCKCRGCPRLLFKMTCWMSSGFVDGDSFRSRVSSCSLPSHMAHWVNRRSQNAEGSCSCTILLVHPLLLKFPDFKYSTVGTAWDTLSLCIYIGLGPPSVWLGTGGLQVPLVFLILLEVRRGMSSSTFPIPMVHLPPVGLHLTRYL